MRDDVMSGYLGPHCTVCVNMAVSRLEERIADPKLRWYFTKSELRNSPSRADGVDFDKELSYRQLTASMIQEMGHRLKLNQVCTATAIVYMHRFFMIHSFKVFNRCNVASAALFLAAKVEEQPQKLEYVARVYHACINRDHPNIDSSSEEFTKLIEDITTHELLILETLGFDLRVNHPHPFVLTCMQRVRASRDLSQTAYFMVHNSLLLTTFCLEHRPTVVACCCIKLACVWKGIQIPPSQDQRSWWENVDPLITEDMLHSLTKEFIDIYKRSPSKLQKKMNEQMKVAQKQMQGKGKQDGSSSSSTSATSTPHSSSSRPPSHENNHSSSSSAAASKPAKPHPPPTQKTLNSTHHHHHHHQRPHQGNAPNDKPHPPLTHSQSQEKLSKHHSSSSGGGVASRQHSGHHRSQVDGGSRTSSSANKHQLAPGGTKGTGHRVGSSEHARNKVHHHSQEGVTSSHVSRAHGRVSGSGGTKRPPHMPSSEMVDDKKRVKLEHRPPPLPPLPHSSGSSKSELPPLPPLHGHSSYNHFNSTLPPLPPPLPPMEPVYSPPPPPPQS